MEEEHGARRLCWGAGLASAVPEDLLPHSPHTPSHPITHDSPTGRIRDLGVSLSAEIDEEEGARRGGSLELELEPDLISALLEDLLLQDLRFAVSTNRLLRFITVDLPCFHRATTIHLHGRLDLVFTHTPPASFPALHSVSLSACRFSIADLLLRCPHLRILRATRNLICRFNGIRSASLQELILEIPHISIRYIDVDSPVLKQLTMTFGTLYDLGVSILAPMMEKVAWTCAYPDLPAGIGPWGLLGVTFDLDTADSGILRLHIDCARPLSFPHNALSLARELEKHLLTDFSVLDLHFLITGHAFGAFVSCLLTLQWVRASTRRLQIRLDKWKGVKELKACSVTCPCDEPINWRSQTISLINLEEVEITGLRGDDREVDFVRLILKCAPMLTRITVSLSDEITTGNDWCMVIGDIFKAYPLVQCNIES